jgi:hypothetical protein
MWLVPVLLWKPERRAAEPRIRVMSYWLIRREGFHELGKRCAHAPLAPRVYCASDAPAMPGFDRTGEDLLFHLLTERYERRSVGRLEPTFHSWTSAPDKSRCSGEPARRPPSYALAEDRRECE